MNRVRLAWWSALALTLLLTGSVLAHAKLKQAEPVPDSTVTIAPKEVKMIFSEEIDTKKSSANVFNATGAQVDNGDSKVNVNERTVMTVTLKQPLANGVYTVKWEAVTPDDDGHSSGEFKFTVQVQTTPSPAPYPLTTPAPQITLAPTLQPTLPPQASPTLLPPSSPAPYPIVTSAAQTTVIPQTVPTLPPLSPTLPQATPPASQTTLTPSTSLPIAPTLAPTPQTTLPPASTSSNSGSNLTLILVIVSLVMLGIGTFVVMRRK